MKLKSKDMSQVYIITVDGDEEFADTMKVTPPKGIENTTDNFIEAYRTASRQGSESETNTEALWQRIRNMGWTVKDVKQYNAIVIDLDEIYS